MLDNPEVDELHSIPLELSIDYLILNYASEFKMNPMEVEKMKYTEIQKAIMLLNFKSKVEKYLIDKKE